MTLRVIEEAQSPDAGLNTYFVVPVEAVLIVEGFQVPLMPLSEVVGNFGAVALLHNVGILANVGVTEVFIPTFTVPEDNLQPLLLVTVTDIVSEVPDAGALYLILLDPLPDVMIEPGLNVHA